MNITIKQHDTKIKFTDTPAIDGVAMTSGDLAGCTLWFIFKGTATDGTAVNIKNAAVITGAAKFEYGDPVPDGVVGKDGRFQQEWELVFPSGRLLTFPNSGYNQVAVLPDLG